MRRFFNMQFAICILQFAIFFCAPLASRAIAAEPMRAGVAVVDITPPVPFRMSGYFMERLSTGTKDPLYAKAAVFQQGDQSAALVYCDLVGISLEVSSAARVKASEATGIPVDHIAISATHTHTGPLYFGSLHDHLHERRVERQGNDPYESSQYKAELIDKLASVIVKAQQSVAAVELSAGFAAEDRISFNRRYHMKDGSVRFNPGQNNPDIVRPAGPIDPQVGIVLLRRPDSEKPFAAIVSFAMHCDTTSGTEYSADYPRYVEDRLRAAFGPDFTLLFGAGTCGDINDIDVTASQRRGAEALGTMLAETIERAVNRPDTLSAVTPSLAVRSTKVDTPLQAYSGGEIEEARQKMYLVGTRELPFLKQVEVTKIVDLKRWPGGRAALEVQVFRLGRDTAVVTLPAEIFVELGLRIKAASPFQNNLVIELTNDGLSYVPTRKAFAEGSYEIINSRVQPGSGERLVEAAIGLLKELE
jgi:hypothetical protein